MSRKSIIIISLAVFLLVAALSILFSQRHTVSRFLEQKIISHIEDEIGRKIAFSDSQIHIRPFYWQWNNAVLSDRKSGEVLLKAKSVRIYLDMDLGLLRAKVVSIRELRFTDPVLTAVRYSDGRTNFAGLFPKRPPSVWHVTIDKIEAAHGQILYDDRLAYRTLSLVDVGIHILPDLKNKKGRGDLTARGYYKDQKIVRKGLRIKGGVAVDFDAETRSLRTATVDALRIALPTGSKVEARGVIYGNGTIDLNGDITLSLSDLAEYIQDQKDLQGKITFSGEVKGSLASPEAKGSVTAEGFSYDTIRYGNLRGDIAYKEDLLKLTSLRSEVLNGRIEGGIEMDFRETPPVYHAALKAEALRPYAVISRYRSGLQQQIREEGVVSAEIEAKGQVPHSSKEAARKILSEAKGWLNYKDEVQRLTFSGEIREGRDISLGINGELTDIARYVKIPRFPLHGAASLNGEISGTMGVPVISGVVMMSKGGVDDIAFDSITADLKFAEDTLSFRPVSFRRGAALYRIAGNIHFRSPGLKDPSFDLQAEINQGSPKDLAAIFYQRLPLDMKTDGRLKFTGDTDDFLGTAELNVSEGSAYGQAFDSGHVAVTLTKDRVILDSVKAERGRESVSGNGWIGFRGESSGAFHAEISSGEFSIENVDLLANKMAVFKGTGTFKITGDGKVTDPVIKASVRIPRLFIKETDTGLAQISLDKTGEEARVAGEALSLRYEGHVAWDREAPFNVKVQIGEGSIHPLLALLRPSMAAELSVSAAGEVIAEGRLADLSTLEVKAVLPQVTGLYGDYRIENDGDIRLSYAENRLTFDSVRFKGEGTALGIIGNLAPHGDVNIFVNGEADLRLLTLLTPEIKYSKGKAFVAFLISGGMENPSIQGGLAVKDGTIRSATLRQTLEEANISLFFNGREIVLESMTGRVGGGTVNGSGKVSVEGFDVKEFGFALEVADALFRYPEGLETRIDGTLLFQGTPRSKGLKGEIRIKKAAYEKNLNLRAMVLELRRKRVTLEQPVPFFGSTDLNIHIVGKKDIWINNNLAKLPVEVDLVLKGTIDHPLLFGRIEANDGTFVFSRNSFQVISATVDFISPDTIRPVIDIHSTTEVNGYHIDLRLSGTLERFNLSLSSEPTLSETDILSLLTVGQTTAESAETMKQVGTVEATAFLAAPIQEKIEGTLQDMLKIDRFQVDPYYSSSTASEGARLTVGKRLLDDRLYVTYTTGITTVEELIKLEYFLGKNVYLVGERDEQGRISGDVKFRFEFR